MLASYGEMKIHKVLEDAEVKFLEEYSFPDLIASSGKPLRFDFCVFDDNGNIDFLIEFQGEQHYKASRKFGGAAGLRKQQYNDREKVEYCLKHGYKLICIPYYDQAYIDYDYIFTAAGY